MTEKLPQGVVGVLINQQGRVVAHAADFALDRPGGFQLKEAQLHRVHRLLSFELVRNTCNPDIVKAMGAYDCDQLMRTLINAHGYKVTTIPIGYDDDGHE